MLKTVSDVFSIKNSANIANIFDEWDSLGLHLIYPKTTSDTVVDGAIRRRLQRKILQFYEFFDLDTDINSINIEMTDTDVRTVESNINSASEAQPINSSITEIESPTAKALQKAKGTDTNKRSGLSQALKYKQLLDEVTSFRQYVLDELSPLIEEFNIIY